MSKSNRNQNIGSVSCATMRPEDLIPSFIDALRAQRPLSREHRKLIREIELRQRLDYCAQCEEATNHTREEDGILRCDVCGDDVPTTYFESNDAREDLDELFQALDTYSPPYFYFGANEGDGADYGWWLCADAIEGDALRVSDLSEVPTDYTGEIFQVSDHGNVTLYVRGRNGHVREVWSIV